MAGKNGRKDGVDRVNTGKGKQREGEENGRLERVKCLLFLTKFHLKLVQCVTFAW